MSLCRDCSKNMREDDRICQSCDATLCNGCAGSSPVPFCEHCSDAKFHCSECLTKAGDLLACDGHFWKTMRMELGRCACGSKKSSDCWDCDEPVCAECSYSSGLSALTGRPKVRCKECWTKALAAANARYRRVSEQMAKRGLSAPWAEAAADAEVLMAAERTALEGTCQQQ
jgi:hypothetical protein